MSGEPKHPLDIFPGRYPLLEKMRAEGRFIDAPDQFRLVAPTLAESAEGQALAEALAPPGPKAPETTEP